MDIGRLNIDEIQKTFRSSWDEADKIMEKYKNICGEYGVGIKYNVNLENKLLPSSEGVKGHQSIISETRKLKKISFLQKVDK